MPGYKAGGPIRSLVNMVTNLRDSIEFRIVTRDRDAGDSESYVNIETDKWTKRSDEYVHYSSKEITLGELREIVRNDNYDMVLLNGVFSEYTIRYLLLRKLHLIKSCPVIIMPRGDLSGGALSLKSAKKRTWLWVSNTLGLYDNLIWQATSDNETKSVKDTFKDYKRIVYLPVIPDTNTIEKTLKKIEGELNIIYISRITKVKNIQFALEALKDVIGKVTFDIYGPLDDKDYWSECQPIISRLPENIQVRYCGSIPNEEVKETISKYDLFFLPTLGENYGHVIAEALCAGTPVLISDKTPWVDLKSKNIGWDIPLSDPEAFISVINDLVAMDEIEFAKIVHSIEGYRDQLLDIDELIENYNKLFQDVVHQ